MIATAGPSALWYLTRGTGLVTLVLLTASVVLGIVQVQRWAPEGSPRFVVVSLHRAVSLLVVALLAVHVLTAVLDSFAPIRLVDVVLPFTGTYRPLWLGLGALAFDLILALTITSLLRRRLGLPAWRAVHWLAYACWPVALVHGWGTGSDARTTWMLALTLGCAAAVLGAVGWRIASGRPDYARIRATAALAAVALTVVVGAWLSQGPLARGWAKRSGTPAALLGPRVSARVPTAVAGAAPQRVPALLRPFSSGLAGPLREGLSSGGMAVVDIDLRLTGDVPGRLRLRLAGDPAEGGGVFMRRSAVTLGPPGSPGQLQGRIVSLQGSTLEALVGSSDGRAERLRVDLQLGDTEATGTVTGSPVTEARG
ncbi:MAG TPA: ferric reductase-like transmembrane domain-containing protein [Solirubrobacteraceae bacterium]|nr:ferric reductase-like transmembrane domain-containing protein [Solirubrobacteraceae bacterium]